MTLMRSPDAALAAIRDDIGDCTRCKLHALGRTPDRLRRRQPDRGSDVRRRSAGRGRGRPGDPVRRARRQLLTKIIEAIGLTRDDVYIANVIKCRPPGNRNPEPDEVATCEPFLFQQIDRIKPKVIVALGTFAAKALLKTQDPISRLRGRSLRLSRRQADPDVPSRLPAAQPRAQARRLGGHEEGPRAPAAVGRGVGMRLVRVAVPVPALDASPTACRTMPRRRSSARACSCRSARASSRAASSASATATRRTARRRRPARSSRSSDVLDDEPFLPPDVVRLASWVAEYYACGIGEALATAMPPLAAAEGEVRGDGVSARSGARTADGAGHGDRGARRRRGRAATRRASARGAGAAGRRAGRASTTASLTARGIASPTLTRLASLGLVSFVRRRVERDPFTRLPPPASVRGPTSTLTAEQDAALARLRGACRCGDVPRRAAARRHRQRQDRDLPAPRRARPRSRHGACCCSCRRSR